MFRISQPRRVIHQVKRCVANDFDKHRSCQSGGSCFRDPIVWSRKWGDSSSVSVTNRGSSRWSFRTKIGAALSTSSKGDENARNENIEGASDKYVDVPKSLTSKAVALVPGLAALTVITQLGFLSADVLGQYVLQLQGISNGASPISGIPTSILIGLAVGNTFKVPEKLQPGIAFASKPLLQAGIICVGAKLSVIDMVSVGLVGLPVVCLSIGTGLTFIPWLGRKMGLPHKMGSLIAVGTSICGVTAITALSPAIKATKRDTAFAIANVVAFGTIGMLTYPYVAHAVLDSSQQIGMFLGIAVHDTSQVIGTALSYHGLYNDELVLKVATVTKLTRNMFLAGVIPYLTYLSAMRDNSGIATGRQWLPKIEDLRKSFPLFIAGFVGMSVFRSAGDVSLESCGLVFGLLDNIQWQTLIKSADTASYYFLGTAMAAVGMSTSINSLKGVGLKPFLVGLLGAGAVSGVGFVSVLSLSHFFGV